MLLQSAINELDSYSLSSGRKVEYIAQISTVLVSSEARSLFGEVDT